MRRIGQLLESRSASSKEQRREGERTARRSAVAFVRWTPGASWTRRSERLGVPARTLQDWTESWSREHLAPGAWGRPALEATGEQRLGLLAFLVLVGIGAGWDRARSWVPGLSRRTTRAVLRQHRRGWAWAQRVGSKILHWTRPGTVWAMDFTFPPRPIERRFRRLLLVRDLGSGKILLALACPGEGAAYAVPALRALFLRFGAPLVLKSDNGSAFISDEMEQLLKEFGVTALLSPARTPRYNGGCEAGIGSLKVRVQHITAWAGRPGDWTLDDVEWARCETNELGRPRGRWRPTPDEAFAARRPITERERQDFLERVDWYLDDEADRGVLRVDGRLGRARLAVATRAAVARALVESGLLEIRTRPIPQPISSPLRATFG